MTTTRQPLLTEEQIQKMLKCDETYWMYWLRENAASVFEEVIRRNPNKNNLIAFLRGKTKRVLNLDRLRADVKAWVDDPNKKYPEWVMAVIHEKNRQMLVGNHTDDLSYDELCCYALAIGINPDDYFEEVMID